MTHPGLAAELVTPGEPWLPVEVLAEVGSTNAVVRDQPIPWRVVSAESQTAGRGRLGREWVTVPGRGLAVSVLAPAREVPLGWIPLVAGLAVAEAIEAAAGVAAVLKWPNDVQLPGDGHRKVAGILCEWTPAGIVVGTGVNVSHSRAELPTPEASSVALAGGECSREALLTAYLRRLADHLTALASHPATIRERYAERCVSIGADVVVREPSTQRRAIVTGVDEEGRLCLAGTNGPFVVTAGDVVHVRTHPAVTDGGPHVPEGAAGP